MTTSRLMDQVERNLIGKRAHLFEYKGEINDRALQQAAKVILAKYPILRCFVERDQEGNDRFRVKDSASEGSPIKIIDSLNDSPLDVANEIAGSKGWDSRQQVFEISLARGDKHGFVVFCFCHSICDGTSVGVWEREFWDVYAQIVAGVEFDTSCGKDPLLPRSPLEVIREYCGEVNVPSTATLKRNLRDSYNYEYKSYENIETEIVLSQHATESLVSRARRLKTTVYALVCGAIVVAHRRQAITRDSSPMRICTAINLRKHLGSPIGSTDVTNLLGMHFAEVDVAADADPISVGREAKNQLSQSLQNAPKSIARGDIGLNIHSMMFTSCENSVLDPHCLSSISLSSPGVGPQYSVPRGLSVVGPSFPSRHHKGSSHLPEASAPLFYPTYAAKTCNDMLRILGLHRCVDGGYSPQLITNIFHEVENLLVSFGNEDS